MHRMIATILSESSHIRHISDKQARVSQMVRVDNATSHMHRGSQLRVMTGRCRMGQFDEPAEALPIVCRAITRAKGEQKGLGIMV